MLYNKHTYKYIQRCLTGKMETERTGKECMGLAERIQEMVLTY